jgi:MFS family permease
LELLKQSGVAEEIAREKAKFAYGIVQTAGGGLGLLAFGPLAVRLGRRRAFWLVQGASLVIIPVTCYLPSTYSQLLILLPVFGFFTLSMHAGFAVYFPELFPTHLRATGSGFCFNGGRIVAASMLVLSGWLKGLAAATPNDVLDLRLAVTLLGSVFALGLLIVCFLPETKGQDLPE